MTRSLCKHQSKVQCPVLGEGSPNRSGWVGSGGCAAVEPGYEGSSLDWKGEVRLLQLRGRKYGLYSLARGSTESTAGAKRVYGFYSRSRKYGVYS